MLLGRVLGSDVEGSTAAPNAGRMWIVPQVVYHARTCHKGTCYAEVADMSAMHLTQWRTGVPLSHVHLLVCMFGCSWPHR